MSSIGTGYDLSASQFSPDGRVFQVEHAQKAVENSGTVVALCGRDCVVVAVEKIVVSKLLEPTSGRRVFTVDAHIGLAFAGLITDARAVVKIARDEAADFRREYGAPIPTGFLARRVSAYMHAYTLYSYVRPFGCSVVVFGCSEQDGPELFMVEPSGVNYGYYGCSMGKARQAAKTEIEKLKLQTLSQEQLMKEAAKIVTSVHDEVKDKDYEVEMSWVGKQTEYRHHMVPPDVHKATIEYANAALLEDSDSDENM